MECKTAGSPRLVYWLLIAQFAVQLGTFFYLYVYVARLEHQLHELGSVQVQPARRAQDVDCALGREIALSGRSQDEVRRGKRSSSMPAAEENAVSEVYRARDEKDGQKETKTAKGDGVWVTTDTRIPYEKIEPFCRRIRENCPPNEPGMPGMPGVNGLDGTKGDQGMPGIQGTPGLPGPRGPPGPPGPRGEPGLDGVDGIPGEPGLDGLPGRSGNDGLPGEDGKPGLDGIPGAPGRNGTDGRDGHQGPQGPPGPQGMQGRMGPRGPAGQDGKPGVPSIVAYTPFRTNASIIVANVNDLLIPPSILDSTQTQTVVSEEGVNVRLECHASGQPSPVFQWHRSDGQPIRTGFWSASAIYGSSLNLSAVHREDMGNYTCTADNGVPPSSSKRYFLNVKFPPLIKALPVVRLRIHSSATLECEVEANPKPIYFYWENNYGRVDNKPERYKTTVEDQKNNKYRMKLKVSRLTSSDNGTTYYCVARTPLSTTKGTITIRDSNVPERPTPAFFGKPAPPRPHYRNLCPPQLNCDSCPRANCGYSGVEARPMTGINVTGMPPRIADGVIGAVGIAVFKGQMDDVYGIWMQDASPKSESTAGKLWVTRSNDTSYIYEYADVQDYKDRKLFRSIKLPYPFQGNGHLVNDGYFFYNPRDRSSIVRLDLTHSEGTMLAYSRLEMELPGLRVNAGNYLYTPNHNYNYVDFDVDENGLWAIYGTTTNGTVVMKVDPDTMTAQYAWGISVDHHKYGEMFVARGVLYAVHSITDPTMNISLAVDLYHGKHLSVSVSFINAYQKVTMLRYNSRTKELYAWDKGTLLAYQVRYKDSMHDDLLLGGPEPKESAAAMYGAGAKDEHDA